MSKTKCGVIALFGKTNAGKSTFLNKLIGEKVSIVSDKTQTTQDVIRGIYTIEDSQIIFLDTPGIYRGKKMSKNFERNTIGALQEADIIVHFMEWSRQKGIEEEETEKILGFFPNKPIIRVVSKADSLVREVPEGVIKISAIDETGFKTLMLEILAKIPEREWQYPDDMYTDQNPHYRTKEIVREKILFFLEQELPYEVEIDIEEMRQENGMLKIFGYLIVSTLAQKKIVIGNNAEMLVKISKNAREELEKIFEQKIFLSLRVKQYEKRVRGR